MSKRPLSHQRPPAWEKEHLWLYLLALGFDPGGGAAAGKISMHLRLGPSMFDNPNKDAFHVVSYFLFSKLDQLRCNEVFRFCFPPKDKKTDCEFRKQCCNWLREISDEYKSDFPSVNASLFLSPGGPKFIHLMFYLARCVLLHHIKIDSSDAGIYFPESLKSRPPDVHMAAAKYSVAHQRFLYNLQKEDVMIQELQKKALILTKQIRDLRHENAELDKQLQEAGKNTDQNQNIIAEKIKQVRCMWASIIETLKHLQKERQVVDSVVKGQVGQYVLDGTSTAVSVPRLLLEKIEEDMHELDVGNIYEAGRLNMLTLTKLLNKAMEIVMLERQRIDKDSLKLDYQYFEGKTKFQNEAVLGLKSLRHKLKQEDHLSVNQSIAEKQKEWDLKWENCLGESPFPFIKEPNPALDLLPAMSPLSFTPATEEAYKSSVFCQYPASFPDMTKKHVLTNEFMKDSEPLRSEAGASAVITERNIASSHCATDSENGTQIPSEKGSCCSIETPKRMEYSDCQILKYKGKNKPMAASKKRHAGTLKNSPSVKTEDPLRKAQEQLAEVVADVVVSDLPQNTGGKGKELDDLIGTLAINPFLPRKQILRTPENLITEVRSSWKKAVEAEESSSMELHHTESSKHTPQDFSEFIDSMAVFLSETPESSCQELSPFRLQNVASSSNEWWFHQATGGLPDVQMSCKRGLTCAVPNKCITENSGLAFESINESDFAPGKDFAKKTQPSYLCLDSSMDTTLRWDVSQGGGFNLENHELTHLSLLEETLREEGGVSISLNRSSGLEAEELKKEHHARDDHIFADSEVEDKQRLNFQSILSRYKALKESFLENQDSPSGKQIPRARSEFNLTQASSEANELLSPLGKPYALDAEAVKKPLSVTLPGRRASLSVPVAFSLAQSRDGTGRQDHGDLLPNVKEKQ